MNREHAETHLRLVAEAELRRATTPPLHGAAAPGVPGAERGAVVLRASVVAAALYDLPRYQRDVIALQYYGNLPEAETAAALRITRGAVHAFAASGMSALRAGLETGTSSRVAQVARALTAVRALDREVADQILDDLMLALGARRTGTAGQHSPDPGSLLRSSVAHLPLGMLMSSRPSAASRRAAAGSFTTAAGGPGPARSPAAPGRVIPLGQVIPVRDGEVSGEMHPLSYAQTTTSCARLTVITRARGEFVPPGIEHGLDGPIAVFPVHQFTARDDHGTSYAMGFRGRHGRRPDELAGEVTLDLGPPTGTRWLDLTTVPGGPAVRIDLTPGNGPPGGAGVTVHEAGTSPASTCCTGWQSGCSCWPWPSRRRSGFIRPCQDPSRSPASPTALATPLRPCRRSGALSPLSPVPGQLAALCANLDVTGHGIAAPPARQLPEPWLSMLAHYRRRKPEQALDRDGCAAAAVALPELDGIRLAILGLHNSDGRTVLYGHASGMTPRGFDGPPDVESDFPLRLWVRDSHGRWHATRATARGWSAEDHNEMTMRLEVVPPLSRATTWIEIYAAGQSAQARTTLPLRWQ